MKTSYFLLGLCVIGVTCLNLLAVPQNVGGGGQFFNAPNNVARLPVHDWFLVVAHWKKGVEIPGEWKADPNKPAQAVMDQPGPVFGLEAYSLVRDKNEDESMARVTVLFAVDRDSGNIGKRLQTNIGLVVGAEPENVGGAIVFKKDGVMITLPAVRNGFQEVVFELAQE
jgi:hypothetical protein